MPLNSKQKQPIRFAVVHQGALNPNSNDSLKNFLGWLKYAAKWQTSAKPTTKFAFLPNTAILFSNTLIHQSAFKR